MAQSDEQTTWHRGILARWCDREEWHKLHPTRGQLLSLREAGWQVPADFALTRGMASAPRRR